MSLFNFSNHGMKDALDIAWLKQRAIANNIANMNTPGYKGKQVTEKTFEELLDAKNHEMYLTHSKHISDSSASAMEKVKVVPLGEMTLDGELAKMNKNTLQYNLLLSVMNRRIDLMQSVMEEF